MSEGNAGKNGDERRDRLASALRENLKKRKAQARAKLATPKAGDSADKVRER